jgi:hypothetical protein
MPTLYCTSKYRKTFGIPERLSAAEVNEGALGPWYANTLNFGPQRLLHYMSGPSLLSVVVRLRERSSTETRFVQALTELLRAFKVPESFIEQEFARMSEFQYARASDRSKLGSLRDQANLASYHLADRSLSDINLRLAETPCGPMSYNWPSRVAPELLERTWGSAGV